TEEPGVGKGWRSRGPPDHLKKKRETKRAVCTASLAPDGRERQCVRRILSCFSSRRPHTRLVSDWSSDVCSSDLSTGRRTFHWGAAIALHRPHRCPVDQQPTHQCAIQGRQPDVALHRSEEHTSELQ